ncbi:MAG: hypothetical protein ACOCU4_03950, partial [Alkalispirochaeta sp.]
MKRAVRVLVAGAVALSLGGCASTTPDARPTPPQAPSAAELRNAVPWTGDDLHFLERAVAAVEEPRQTSSGAGADAGDDADTDADASRPEIILGEMATLTELVVAVSFGEWEAGRRVLVDAGVVDPRAAGQ